MYLVFHFFHFAMHSSLSETKSQLLPGPRQQSLRSLHVLLDPPPQRGVLFGGAGTGAHVGRWHRVAWTVPRVAEASTRFALRLKAIAF